MQNLGKDQNQPPVVILQQTDFLQHFSSVLEAENHQKI